ncbi:hypothetical protein FA15DRAFT_759696 [Coprinopsis marcescibilis]|uniref:Uncharacterized protein n=1 Tax=Coprinopsis marcescibilis TaxID=230819 RepID=A0A5C3KJ92_COPMA|nr:hypothetical protein FA15DRAFT_759696 [Coprinopsis marcescibilis]
MRILIILAIATCAISTPVIYQERRDLFGLLVGEEVTSEIVDAIPSTTDLGAVHRLDSSSTSALIATASHHHRGSTRTTSLSTPTALGTNLGLNLAGGGDTAKGAGNTSPTTTDSVYQANPAETATAGEQALVTPPGELAQWKVIGISIICVTFVAIIIVLITFFDTWSGFLKDVFCGRKQDSGSEVFMSPDWKRRTWELKLANEGGHRYPSMTSLDSVARSGKAGTSTGGLKQGPFTDYVVHAEMALGRKFSARQAQNAEWP